MPATRYCANPDHRCVDDCKREMNALQEPVNGAQTCALVAARNCVLAFRKMMRWGDPGWTSAQPPPEQATAGEVWFKFDKLMNGCVDLITECSDSRQIAEILGAYVDYADPLRASLALALRQRFYHNEARPNDELDRQLQRQLAGDPVLKYMFDKYGAP